MPDWNELFKASENLWKKPHERVIDLIPRLKQEGLKRVLDLGCGAGRHIVYLSQTGFTVTGLDSAESGLIESGSWLAREGLNTRLVQGEMSELPFFDHTFEAVISLYVVHHCLFARMKRTIEEIWRILAPGGLALLAFPSRYGSRANSGQLLEPGTVIPDFGLDSGIPHHYSDLEDLVILFSQFKILDLRLDEKKEEDYFHSHWIIILRKAGEESTINA
jgi:SAM-dependent methyltransferase